MMATVLAAAVLALSDSLVAAASTRGSTAEANEVLHCAGPGKRAVRTASTHCVVSAEPALSLGAEEAKAPFPDYDETFTVETIESTPKEGVVLRQTIVHDYTLRRSMMRADGSLVRGVLQQILRCDIHPTGWFADIGGPNPQSLQCTNMTRNSDPAYCQWTPFWDAPPANATMHEDVLNGTKCTRWDYWSGGESFSFWGTHTNPLRTAKTFTQHIGYELWAIDFVNFVGGTPPLSAFDTLPGVVCPAASPPPPATGGLQAASSRGLQ